MKSIVIVQTILPHYRQSFFEQLCKSIDYDFFVIAGKPNGKINTFSPTLPQISDSLRNTRIRIGAHLFIFQHGLLDYLKKKRPAHVVLGGPDLHIISSLLVFVYLKCFTKTKIHWWTHGLHSKNKWLLKFQMLILSLSYSALTYEEEGKTRILKALRCNEQRVTAIKNAICTEDYGFNKPGKSDMPARPDPSLNILFAGRLKKAKRCDVLIRALALLDQRGIDFQANIIGSGEDLAHCIDLTATLKIADKVTFHGELYGEEVEPFFLNSDLFVLPGKVGLSIVQALSYGLPVLTTDQSIHSPEIALIKAGRNGDFFQGFSAESLASKIAEWKSILKANGKAIQIKDFSRQSVMAEGYTPEKMTEAFVEHFKTLNE